MQSTGVLLCAIDNEDRAPSLIATARAWGAATRWRVVFVHCCDGAAREVLAALGIRDDERLVEAGELTTVVAAAATRLRPELVLTAWSPTEDGRPGRVVGAMLEVEGVALAVAPGHVGEALSDRPVACAVSLGPYDEAAVRFARAFASASDARLTLRSVLGSRETVLLAAERARSSVSVRASHGLETNPRVEVITERLLEIARDADASVLVIASGADDTVSQTLRTDSFWSAAPCPVIVVRP